MARQDKQINVRLPAEMLEQLTEALGDESREQWVRRAIDAQLKGPGQTDELEGRIRLMEIRLARLEAAEGGDDDA